MFDLRIVLPLALVCLQVSGSPLDVYNQLGGCFKTGKAKFFQDFFPYVIKLLPFQGGNFFGMYKNVKLSGLENLTINAKQVSKDSDAVALIEFNNIFSNIVISGTLEGFARRDHCEGSISGYATNVNLKGNVSYEHPKVTKLELIVTVEKVSVKFEERETPFEDEETTKFFQDLFANENNENAMAQNCIQLINARIDTPEKIAHVKAECSIQV